MDQIFMLVALLSLGSESKYFINLKDKRMAGKLCFNLGLVIWPSVIYNYFFAKVSSLCCGSQHNLGVFEFNEQHSIVNYKYKRFERKKSLNENNSHKSGFDLCRRDLS